VRLLLIDPIEKNSYVGVGTTQKRGMSEIVALSDAPSDSSVFEAAMHRATKEIHSRIGAFREPSYSVIDSGAIQPAARPAMGGDGIQLRNGPAGTLGCMVKDQNQTGLFLSCNHVIADCNGAAIHDPIDEPAYSGSLLGTLHDFESIKFGGAQSNQMDAAVGLPNPAFSVSPGFRSQRTLLQSPDLAPAYNATVEKEGNSTGRTTGILTIKNLSILVNFPNQTALFDGQFGVVGAPGGFWGGLAQPRFAQAGDSGALVTLSSRAVGLLFAVSSRIDLAYVNPIGGILSRFGVTIF